MDDKRLLNKIDMAVSPIFLCIILALFLVAPTICRYGYDMNFPEELLVSLVSVYGALELVIVIVKVYLIKEIFRNYFPRDYRKLYLAGEVTAMLMTAFGNWDLVMRIEEVLSNREEYDKNLVYFYNKLNWFPVMFLMVWLGGAVVLGVYYMVAIG